MHMCSCVFIQVSLAFKSGFVPLKAINRCDRHLLNATTQLNAKLFMPSARDLIDYSLIYCDCCTPSVSHLHFMRRAVDSNKLFLTLIYTG